jgi:MFS family permease
MFSMSENPYESPQPAEPAIFGNSPASPTWVRWQMMALLMGFTALNHFHRQSLPAVVSTIIKDCGFDEQAIAMGWIYFSFLLGYVLFMVVGGWVADWRGGRSALILSGLGTGALVAATGLCGYIPWPVAAFVAFLIVRFPMGALTTPLFPAAGRIAHAWIPFGTRAWANGLVLGATIIGVATAPVVFGYLSDVLTWQLACVLMGVVTMLLTGLWAIYGCNSPDEHPQVNQAELNLINATSAEQKLAKPAAEAKPAIKDFSRLLANPSLLLLTANYAAVGYYEYTLFYWIKRYFEKVLLYDEHTSRYYVFIVTLALLFAMPLGGIASDALVRRWGYRWGRATVPIVGMLASAALLYIATHVRGDVAVVSLFFLAHASIGLCEAPTWVAGLEVGGKSRGTSAAIVNTGGNLGGLFATVVTPYVADYLGWNAGFLVASVACLLGVMAWLGIRLKQPVD